MNRSDPASSTSFFRSQRGAPPASLQSLESRYRDVRFTSITLAEPLSAEDCALQSMPDASPVKWHLAHTSWFFETVLLAQRPGYKPFDPAFAYLFNSYYESAGTRHPRLSDNGEREGRDRR